MYGNVKIVIGSWGSCNECNERALGSKWLDLSDYNDWNEVVEELQKEGFELDGIDEELFIQDVEGIPDNSINWDYVNPEDLFNTLKDSDILDDEYKYEIFTAYLEIENFKEFESLVDSYGSNWDRDINLWKNYSWYDLAYNLMHECYEIPDYLENYIDYTSFARDLEYEGNFHEYSEGIIEIRR